VGTSAVNQTPIRIPVADVDQGSAAATPIAE
jgi:hypothetical protein